MKFLGLSLTIWAGIMLAFGLGIAAILFIPQGFYDLGGDSAQYITLAESLSQGKGLRMLNVPGAPFSSYYPPVFPLMLTPILSFLGRDFYAMHLLVAVLGIASLMFLYTVIKECADASLAGATVVLLGMNWCFMLYATNYILSDIPYLFFSSVTLLLALRYLRSDRASGKDAFFLVAWLLLSYLARYIGLTLWIALMTALGTQENIVARGKKLMHVGLGFVSVVLVWHGFAALRAAHQASHFGHFLLINPYVPGEGSLVSNPLGLLARYVDGVNYYYQIIAHILFPFVRKPGALNEFLCGIVFLFLVIGFLYSFRQKGAARLLHYYFIGYFLIIVMWPFSEGNRFMLPLLGLVLYFLLIGLRQSLQRIMKRPAPVLLCLFVGMCVVSGFTLCKAYRSAPGQEKNLSSPAKNFFAMQEWIKIHLPAEGIIVSRKPTITYFLTGHQSLAYPFTLDQDVLSSSLAKNNVKYIVLDEFSRESPKYLLPFLRANASQFTLVWRIGNTGLFEVAAQ